MSTGTMTAYDQVGKKEDVSDVITNISPTKTPFQTSIGSESAHNIVYQWQEDSLMAVSSSPQVEGANAPTATWQATVMRNNTTQIFNAVAQTSGTTDAIETYGRDKEMAYQLALRSAELKRNLEWAFIGTRQTQTAGADGTARQFAGFQQQLDSTVQESVGASGSPAALTETALLNLAQTLYNDGADPTTLMVKPADGLKVAAFQTGATGREVFIANGETKVTNVVDVYRNPFGTFKVVLNRFIAGGPMGGSQSDALLYDPAMWKKVVLRNWFRETLAKTGDFTQVQIVGEFGLKHRNYKASGLMTWLS